MYKSYYKFNGNKLELNHVDTSTEKMDCTFGEKLFVPSPYETRKILFISDQEAIDRGIAREKGVLENGFTVVKEVSHVNIKSILALTEDMRTFKEYNEEMENALQESIKNNGLFSPIIIWESANNEYVVISGLERLKAYHFIYDEAEKLNDTETMKKYETIPSFIMGMKELTEYQVKQIYLESNLCTRIIDGESSVKAYSEYYMLLKYLKEKRNEYNILDEMKEKFRVSKQTIYNYLSFNKLIEPLMYLFQEKVINFKSALKLSKFKREIQEKIVETVGIQNINNTKIKAINEKAKNEKEFLINLKTVKDLKYPYWSFLKLKLPTKHIEEVAPLLEKFVRQNLKFFLKVIYPKIRV